MDLPNETWKAIEGYGGFYEVSTMGRIRTMFFKNRLAYFPRIKIRKFQTHPKTGYDIVNLGQKSFTVHRVVAKTFIPNPENKPEVNHKNGVKTDNRVENLEWMTRSENMRHMHDMGMATIPSNAKLTPEKVLEIKRLLRANEISEGEIARRYGVYYTLINKIKHGIVWRRLKLPEDVV